MNFKIVASLLVIIGILVAFLVTNADNKPTTSNNTGNGIILK